jgi:hypothetical protein
MAQNLRFQEQIDERIKREDRMEGLLRELIVRALRRVRGSVARRVY